MNKLDEIINKFKRNYASKISYPDVKKTLRCQWDCVKKLAKDKIIDMKKTSYTLSKDSVKMVFTTLTKIGYGVSRFGVSSFFFCLNHTKPGLYFKVIALTYFAGRAIYVYGTINEKEITIHHKWVPNSKKETDEYMVSDKDGIVYKVRNSVWYLQLKASENWDGMEKNRLYKVKIYGLSYPFFGIHPIIVRSHAIH